MKEILISNNPGCEDQVIFLFKGEISLEANQMILTEGQKLEYFNLEEFKNLRVPPVIKDYILKNSNIFFNILISK